MGTTMLTNVPNSKTAPREYQPVNRDREISSGFEKGANRDGNAPLLVRYGDSPRCGCRRTKCRKMLALLGLHAENRTRRSRRMK